MNGICQKSAQKLSNFRLYSNTTSSIQDQQFISVQKTQLRRNLNKSQFNQNLLFAAILAFHFLICIKAQESNPLCKSSGEYYDSFFKQCKSCHQSCSQSWCIDETEDGCIQCMQNSTVRYRVLGPKNTNQSNQNRWQCVDSCFYDQIPMSVYRPEFKFNRGYLYYCRTPEIYIDSDFSEGNIELGTKQFPFRQLDDGFRELFNRDQIYAKDGSIFNVTVYLKASGFSQGKIWTYSNQQPQNMIVQTNLTIYSLIQPIVIVNMHIEMKPYFEIALPHDGKNYFTEIKITDIASPRSQQNFNPTWLPTNQIRDYDYDRLISLGVLDPVNKLQPKYKITSYNSSITVSNFYFNEVDGMDFNIDTLFRTYLSPYKWLILRSCIFEMKNQISFTMEGMNNRWENLTINVTRSNQIAQLFSIANCDYYSKEGIANNQIFSNIKYIGNNRGSYYRIFVLRMPQNASFINSEFMNVIWEPLNFGLTTGYLYNFDCPEITNFHVIHENNTFINKSPLNSVIPIQIFSDYVISTVRIKAILRNNVFINQTVVPIGLIYSNFQLQSYSITMIMENNYFENVIHTGSTQISTVHAVAVEVIIRNITFKNCNLAMGMMIRAKSAIIEKVNFINVIGGSKLLIIKLIQMFQILQLQYRIR